MFWAEFVAVLFLVLTIHEIFHAIAGKMIKLKNHLFGFAIFGAFVGVDLEHATRKQKTFVYLSGPVFSMMLGFIIYYIMSFSGIPIPFVLYTFLNIFIFLLFFVNGFNLVPALNGIDAYNVLKIFTKKTKYISIFLNIAICIGIFYLTYSYLQYSLIYSVLSVASYIVPVVILLKIFKGGIDVENTKRGFHRLGKIGFYYGFDERENGK